MYIADDTRSEWRLAFDILPIVLWGTTVLVILGPRNHASIPPKLGAAVHKRTRAILVLATAERSAGIPHNPRTHYTHTNTNGFLRLALYCRLWRPPGWAWVLDSYRKTSRPHSHPYLRMHRRIDGLVFDHRRGMFAQRQSNDLRLAPWNSCLELFSHILIRPYIEGYNIPHLTSLYHIPTSHSFMLRSRPCLCRESCFVRF